MIRRNSRSCRNSKEDKVSFKREAKHCINARTVLWYLSFTGFAVNYMVRINLNLTIVFMVRSLKPTNGNHNNTSEVVQGGISSKDEQNYGDDTYEWTSQQQNFILGAFFWIHWCTGLLGGLIAHQYGTKHIFGLGNFVPTVLCFFIPIAASIDYRILVGIRVIQGLFTGLCWSAMNTLIGKWVPPHERSRFVSSFYGSSVGIGVTYFISGFVMERLGWKYVFYTTGLTCLVWYVFWCCLVYERPEDHPWISKEELKYICEHTNEIPNENALPIPWKDILTTRSFWIATYAYWGILWSITLLQTYMPLYFTVLHKLDAEQIGIVLLWPNITKWLFSFVLGMVIDNWIRKNTFSTTQARKIAVTLATSVQAAIILVLAIEGSKNVVIAILTVTIATTLQGATASGLLAIFIDISPNFSSILYGICNTIANTSGFIIPYVISFVLEYGQEPADQWRCFLLIVVGILVVTNVLFVWFGDAKMQDWNSVTPESSTSKMQARRY